MSSFPVHDLTQVVKGVRHLLTRLDGLDTVLEERSSIPTASQTYNINNKQKVFILTTTLILSIWMHLKQSHNYIIIIN